MALIAAQNDRAIFARGDRVSGPLGGAVSRSISRDSDCNETIEQAVGPSSFETLTRAALPVALAILALHGHDGPEWVPSLVPVWLLPLRDRLLSRVLGQSVTDVTIKALDVCLPNRELTLHAPGVDDSVLHADIEGRVRTHDEIGLDLANPCYAASRFRRV